MDREASPSATPPDDPSPPSLVPEIADRTTARSRRQHDRAYGRARAKVTPSTTNRSPPAAACAAVSSRVAQSRRALPAATNTGSSGGERAGAGLHPRLLPAALLGCGAGLGAWDRAGGDPDAPADGVVVGPFGEITVEAADGEQGGVDGQRVAGQVIGWGRAWRRVNAAASCRRHGQAESMRTNSRRCPRVIRAATFSSR
jgi:hypothetical protein